MRSGRDEEVYEVGLKRVKEILGEIRNDKVEHAQLMQFITNLKDTSSSDRHSYKKSDIDDLIEKLKTLWQDATKKTKPAYENALKYLIMNIKEYRDHLVYDNKTLDINETIEKVKTAAFVKNSKEAMRSEFSIKQSVTSTAEIEKDPNTGKDIFSSFSASTAASSKSAATASSSAPTTTPASSPRARAHADVNATSGQSAAAPASSSGASSPSTSSSSSPRAVSGSSSPASTSSGSSSPASTSSGSSSPSAGWKAAVKPSQTTNVTPGAADMRELIKGIKDSSVQELFYKINTLKSASEILETAKATNITENIAKGIKSYKEAAGNFFATLVNLKDDKISTKDDKISSCNKILNQPECKELRDTLNELKKSKDYDSGGWHKFRQKLEELTETKEIKNIASSSSSPRSGDSTPAAAIRSAVAGKSQVSVNKYDKEAPKPDDTPSGGRSGPRSGSRS